MDRTDGMPKYRHHMVESDGVPVHVVESGGVQAPTVLFLHGWPECWLAFERVMELWGDDVHAFAMDLPGVGGSTTPPVSNDKRTLARCVHGVAKALGLNDLTLVGHDVGGQITYAFLHEYPDVLQRAVIMNVSVPGVQPWSAVIRNPRIWHFAFHAIPGLPETLVAGRERAYFDYFFDTISANPGAITDRAREAYVQAYSRPLALHTGFEWYRAFPEDEADNLETKQDRVRTPVLYLRGEREAGDMQEYLMGLNEAGLENVQIGMIAKCGHFAPEERPEGVLAALKGFMSQPSRGSSSPKGDAGRS